jgi:predicted PurR-regulated permease PerM
MNEFPTPWQQKTMWSALAALAVVVIGAIAVGLVWLVSTVIGFLQPILIPFAIAGVMAYLLEPVVAKITAWGTSRQRSVMSVFALVTVLLAGVLLWVIPAIWVQTTRLVHKVPAYRDGIIQKVGQFNDWTKTLEQKFGVHGVMPQIPDKVESPLVAPSATPDPKPAPGPSGAESAPAASAKPMTPPPADATSSSGAPPGPKAAPALDLQSFLRGDWVRTTLPVVLEKTWKVIANSVGGFLGVFGFLLSMIIVPIYLYYFLIEARHISQSWGDYLPLRASEFKNEVVAAFNEINGYLIAFFRGQLLVSLINGTATGILLMAVGLDFGLLIGLVLCFLGIIPYLGIVLCWIPAVIIASVQGGIGTWVPSDHWWVFPLVVTLIFVVVQQIDGLFITPKIVGESVGLHPMTVIASVFVWSLLIGGLLGAIVAVPLTATIKVLLRRYVWQRTLFPTTSMVTEESVAIQQAQDPAQAAAGSTGQ